MKVLATTNTIPERGSQSHWRDLIPMMNALKAGQFLPVEIEDGESKTGLIIFCRYRGFKTKERLNTIYICKAAAGQ